MRNFKAHLRPDVGIEIYSLVQDNELTMEVWYVVMDNTCDMVFDVVAPVKEASYQAAFEDLFWWVNHE